MPAKELSIYTAPVAALIDFYDPALQYALFMIFFNPTWWNVMARLEYKTHFITKIFCGSRYAGCYALAVAIFSLGLFRDSLYERALQSQPTLVELSAVPIYYTALLLIGSGLLFVLSSTWALGITGTFLGDYFGILLEKRVEGFPFNVLDNPMYMGSTMIFLGTALVHRSPAGIFLTLVVYVVYRIALLFEEPFTAYIYAQRDAARKKTK